jgi:AmmeMemoRadiSam system protein B
MTALNIPNLDTCSCGEGTILTAMMAGRSLGANQALLLRYANSGDTPFAGRDRVVG